MELRGIQLTGTEWNCQLRLHIPGTPAFAIGTTISRLSFKSIYRGLSLAKFGDLIRAKKYSSQMKERWEVRVPAVLASL
jgi:hypothetical protein